MVADFSNIIIFPLLLLNSGIVCFSEAAIVVWENASSVLCYFRNGKLWVKNTSTENQEFLFGKAARLPVAQVICLSHATVFVYLLVGGGMCVREWGLQVRTRRQQKRQQMCLLASSSVVWPNSTERWSRSPWNSGNRLHQPPLSQFQLLLFNACCTAHQKSQRSW